MTAEENARRSGEALWEANERIEVLEARLAKHEEEATLLVDEWMAQTADGRGFKVDHWRGQDYVEGLEAGREECALALRAALEATP